jgi:hypothetical protein
LERYRLIYDLGNCTGNSKDRLKKVIGSLFSREWDKLFDDGVFFSSYSLIFRDKTIKKHYKNLHDDLRQMLTNILKDANENGVIEIDDVERMADLIFILIEGAYYYLSMVSNRTEYNSRIAFYQKTVWSMLNMR